MACSSSSRRSTRSAMLVLSLLVLMESLNYGVWKVMGPGSTKLESPRITKIPDPQAIMAKVQASCLEFSSKTSYSNFLNEST